MRRATGGVIEIDGEPVVIHSPRAAIDLGIGFLTENRKEQGLFLEMAAQENITMATLERDARWGMLNRKKAQTLSDDAISCSIFACRTRRYVPAAFPAAISKSC